MPILRLTCIFLYIDPIFVVSLIVSMIVSTARILKYAQPLDSLNYCCFFSIALQINNSFMKLYFTTDIVPLMHLLSHCTYIPALICTSALLILVAKSEANVKTNRMITTKWAYHRRRSFTSNYFIFLKVLFQFQNLL